ncbi:MAG: universal stress protein [Actinomycetota bacterium]|nr:universal stress protein [Actinomycetota bacterium]
MSTVVAALDVSTTAPAVLRTAHAIADVLGAEVEAVHVREGDHTDRVVALARDAGVPLRVVDGDPSAEIVEALDRAEAVLGVVGARGEPSGPSPAGHVASTVAQRCAVPLLVVPPSMPDGEAGEAAIRRALVPLEGSEHSTACLAPTLRDLADGGVELVAVHVFDARTVPRFRDQPAHADTSYATEFASRWCDDPPVEVHLVRGSAPAAVLDAAEEHGVDLIVLGWHRDLWSSDRAPVVRSALALADVPVLLLSPGSIDGAEPDGEG